MSQFTDLWAKSPRGGETTGETLLEHTLQVVRRVAALRERGPFLAELSEEPRFWHRLGLAAAAHDLGKADPRFQMMVKDQREWNDPHRERFDQRHEVLSLTWLDWILGDDPHEDRRYVAAAIAAHHRDYKFIGTKYDLGTDWNPLPNVADLVKPIPPEVFARTAALFLDEILPAIRPLGLLDDAWQAPAPWVASSADSGKAVDSIRRNLREWEYWMDTLRPPINDQRQQRIGILTRGIILMADHAGSAAEHFRTLPLLADPVRLTQKVAPPPGKSFYPHQDEAALTKGHAILVAPTGSGKTEAALRWVARQASPKKGHPPLFYVLPFKASMNAMSARLVKNFAEDPIKPTAAEQESVALQHSSALGVLYSQLMERGDSSAQAGRLAVRQKSLAKLHTTPVRVLSPYQILRAAYQLKGHEAIWTDAAGGLFIFDEIHAYEAQKLARILEMLRFLVDRLGAQAFVMTATMPKPILERIAEILGHPPVIKAADDTYAQFRRHCLKLCETGLLDDATVAQIVARIRNKEAVLCVATTVKRAQELQQKLQATLKDQTEVKLLHSRFTGEDRDQLEQLVRTAVATNAKAGERKNIVLVATQVVEVSLDVDFDVLFTDPAPIEALLQRFGRVNRSRRAEPHDVIVCTVVDDSQPVYDVNLVTAAIGALRLAENQIIDESQVQSWIDTIYAGPIGDDLAAAIEQCSVEFRTTVLDQLAPFDTQEDLEELFYKQFDGAEVIPKCLVERYKTLLDTEPLRASSLTVPISHQQLMILKSKGQLLHPSACGLPAKSPFVADVLYTKEAGLNLSLRAEEDNT